MKDDARKHNGGARAGAGRKPKSVEDGLIEKLLPYEDGVIEKWIEKAMQGDMRAIQLFASYLYGQPKQKSEVKLEGDNLPKITWGDGS